MNNTRYLGLHFFHTESDTMTDQVGKVDRRVRQYQLVQKRTTLSSCVQRSIILSVLLDKEVGLILEGEKDIQHFL